MTTELKAIETGTSLGTVYINRDHITHIEASGEFSRVWLVSGRYVEVEGAPADVEMNLFPFVA